MLNVSESSQSIWKPLFWLVFASLIAVYLLFSHHSHQLQQAIGDEHQTLRSVNRSLDATKDELSTAQQALEAAKAEITALKSKHAEQLDAVKSEHQVITAGLQQAHEQRLAELSARLDDFTTEKSLLTAETEAWKRATDKLEQDLRESVEASAALEARLADTAETRRELEIRLAADDGTIAELNALLNRANQTEALLNDKLERGSATQDQIKALVATEEAAILELQEKLVATTQSRAELERLLATTNEASATPDSAAAAPEPSPEQQALQARVEQLQSDVTAITAERDQLAVAQTTSQSGDQQQAAMAELREAFDAERATFEAELADASQRIDRLQAELDAGRKALEHKLAEAKAQHEDARAAALAEAEEQRKAAIANLQQSQAEAHAQTLADAEQRIENLSQALEAERERGAQQTADYNQEQAQLRAELDEATGALDELQQTLAARNDDQKSQAADYEARIAEAEAALDAMRREIQAQEQALQSAREQSERLRQDAVEQTSDQIHDFYEQFAPLGAQLTDRGLLVNLSGDNIRFPSGSAQLPEDAEPTLTRIADILAEHPKLIVQIEGHTDSSGNADLNLQLSEQRAAAVRDALTERGIQSARLSIKGMGSTNPIASNATDTGRQRNRRVELYVVREE
jgi:flagellar motor protein MotB